VSRPQTVSAVCRKGTTDVERPRPGGATRGDIVSDRVFYVIVVAVSVAALLVMVVTAVVAVVSG
jgi:hypothetical protein